MKKILIVLSAGVLAFFMLTTSGCGSWWPWGHHHCSHHEDGAKHRCRHH